MTLLESLKFADSSRLTVEEALDMMRDVWPKLKALASPLQDIANKYTQSNLTPERMGGTMEDVM